MLLRRSPEHRKRRMAARTLLLLLPLLVQYVGLVQAQWKTFVVPHVDGQDDSPALQAVLPDYSVNSTILFKKGVHYNIFTPLKFPVLTNVEVRVEGNLSYPNDIATIQGPYSLRSCVSLTESNVFVV